MNETSTRSVVVPVYDEPAAVWSECVDRLVAAGWEEVIVSIDAPDAASRAVLERYRTRPNITISADDERRGKGGALREGLACASGDILGYVDADGSISAHDLNRVFAAVEDGSGGVAVASRNATESSRDGQAIHRRLLGVGYRYLARRVTGVHLSDFQCGAKAFRAEVWDEIAGSLTEDGFAIDTELIAHASHQGYEITEVPIAWRDAGDSQVSVVRDVPDMFASLLRLRHALGRNDDVIRLALVSDHPPNRGHLAEYGEELAASYDGRGDVEVTVLARRGQETVSDDGFGYPVERVWERDSTRGTIRLLRALCRGRYDAIHFNVHMTYFGDTPHHRFIGLSLPVVTRLITGAPVLTTLHDMLEVIEVDEVDERVSLLERFGARIATQLVLFSNATTVTSQQYREALEGRYLGPSAVHVPHGTFQRTDGGVPPIDPPLRLLQFGFLGPTKDIPTTVEAFRTIRRRLPDAELVIAGGSHPDHPGYQSVLDARYGGEPGVRFVGYVEDEDLDGLWHNSSLLVMPYRTSTGVSGVFQLAKTYGIAVVAYDTDGLRTATVGTGGTAAFVPPGDAGALAAHVLELWSDRSRLDAMAHANANAASQVSMGEVAEQMLCVLVDRTGLDGARVEVGLDG